MLFCGIPAVAEAVSGTDETASGEGAPVVEQPKTVQVVFAADDILQGDRIGNDDLTVKEVPNVNLPDNVLSSTEEVVGKFAKESMYAGEYVNSGLLTKDTVIRVNEDVLIKPIKSSKDDFLIVTDYIRANTGLEVEYYLQQIIDKNPNRTIYFPAGEYVLGSPIATPCDAKYSVSLLLDDGAVIKASDNWRPNGEWDALICLGGTQFKNDIYTPGSYYQLQGGLLDCRDLTNGVAIEGGRETVVRNICIKDAKIGVNVRKATNNVSSDCDFEDITVIGSNKPGTIGVNNLACDNTFSTIKVYDMQIGLAGNYDGHVKEIYVFNNHPEKLYTGTVGIASTGTFLSNCYVENCETAYLDVRGEIWDCTAAWTSDVCKKQTAFGSAKARPNSTAFVNCKALFHKVEGAQITYVAESMTDKSYVFGGAFDEELVTVDRYKDLLDTEVIWK